MMRLHLFCVVVGLLAPYVTSKHVQFYRKDYTYIEEFDAFYKLHWDSSGSSWSDAFNACYEEGAKLFYPSGDEWMIVKNLTDAMQDAPNTTVLYVGLHDEFSLGEFITIDGNPTDSPLDAEDEIAGTPVQDRCLFMDYITGQFRISHCAEAPNAIKPFVCKKVDDESCPTTDNGYKYVKKLNKCYKVNNIKKTWQAAMRTCFMEGGLLAVIQSNTDVPNWVNTDQVYFVGFRKMFSSSVFYTVKGNKFENPYFDADYNIRNYPNNECGSIMYNNNNNDLLRVKNCYEKLSFICEMPV